MKKYIFINDTRTQKNWGCHATSTCFEEYYRSLNYQCTGRIFLHDLLGNKQVLENAISKLSLDGVNWAFVNGEGSLYDNQGKGLMMLESIKVLKAKKPDIKIFVVNSTYDLHNPNMANKVKEVEKDVCLFTARENISMDYLRRIDISNAIFQPDFLYGKELDNYKLNSYIVVGGNSNYYRPDRHPYDALSAYRNLVRELQKLGREIILYSADVTDTRFLNPIASEFGLKHLTATNTNWTQAMKVLSEASLSISGRYHPSIMALCGNTPCYLLSANNCKMQGTHQLFYPGGSNFSHSHKLNEHHKKIVQWANNTLQNYDEEVDRVKARLDGVKHSLEKAKETINDHLR